MAEVTSGAMALAMAAAFLLAGFGIKLALNRQTPHARLPDDRRRGGSRHERDDLDGVGGLIGSVASRMSR